MRFKEAIDEINKLKEELNEVNLLNAKLLFSNKLFRNHSLNESQKMKVIENFDRAQSLREVKLVFATLSESFNLSTSKTKRTIKSKPTGFKKDLTNYWQGKVSYGFSYWVCLTIIGTLIALPSFYLL